jgi:hypothetical protein
MQRQAHLSGRKLADPLSDEAVAKIVVRREIAGRDAGDAGMTGQVHGVGDDSCGRIG